MGPGDVSLICYFGGELIDDDKNAKYIGGSKKGDIVANSIGYASFKKRIQEIVKIPLNGMEFDIKCGVRFDEFTLIGMDVDDDQSLRFVMDRSKFIMAYILKRLPTATTYTAIQRVEDVIPFRAATTAIQREDPLLPAAVQFQAKNPIDGTSNDKSVEMETVGLKPPGNDGMNTNKGASPSECKFVDWFPEKLSPFITGYENPVGDGNCGFRALCMALGRDQSEWGLMRQELKKEIDLNNNFYNMMFGIEETCDLVQGIEHPEGPARRPKWMDMPYTGFVFAQAFEVVLVHYSKTEWKCWTFIPFLSPPNADDVNVKVLGIAFVENNEHYIKLDFRDGCPLPPFLQLPSNWRTISPGTVNSWEELLAPRLRAFIAMNVRELQSDKCIGETIIDEKDLVLQGKNSMDGTRDNNLVNGHGDLNRIDNSKADIDSSGHMHHRFSQPNADRHDDISICYHEHDEGNEVNVPENAVYEEKQVTSQMEQKVSPSDFAIDSSDYGFALGREFPDIDALRNALSDMAVQTGHEYKHGRTSPSQLSMKCSTEGCKWHIQARRMLPKLPIFKVVKYEEVHSCVVRTSTNSGDSKDHPQATVRWILSKVKSSIEKDPYMEPNKIVKEIKDRYRILISYNKAVKAKTKALNSMRNRIQKDTCFHPEICRALIRELEYGGTICRLGLSSDGSSFQHLFWAFPACIDALRNHLRPVVYVGKVDTEIGVLIYARGVDGDGFDSGRPIHVGFAHCVRDDVETWEAFLGWLKEFVLPPTSAEAEAEAGNSNKKNTIPFTIVTDVKETAVTRAVETVLPHLHHFFETDHLVEVFYQKFNDDNLNVLCLRACRTFSLEKCESALEEMNRLNKEAYEWLESVGSKCHWAIAFSPSKHVPLNWKFYSFHLKSMVLKKNKMSIVEIVESSREWVARYFSQRRIDGELITTGFTPGVTRGVTNDFENARYYLPHCKVKESINGHNNKYYYQVTYKSFDKGSTCVVDLEERSCTCGEFQATEYPCHHAFAVIVHLKLAVKNYVSHTWYSLDTYIATYAGSLPPPICLDISQWCALPLPPRRTQVGRPRKLQKI